MPGIRTALLFALSLFANGADLAIDWTSVQPGSSGVAVVRISTQGMGSRVAALQFDLVSDALVSLSGSAGPSAAGAGKTMSSWNLGSGRTRFLLFGLNGNVINDGEAARVSVAVDSSMAPGIYPLALQNVLASDPEGYAVPLSAVDSSVAVGSTVADPPSSGTFAHVAAGAGWKTSFTLINLGAADNRARLLFRDDAGSPLTLRVGLRLSPQDVLASATSVDVTIPGNGIAVVDAGSPDQSIVQVGWAQVQASPDVAGWATFGLATGSGPNIEVVVPMDTRPARSMILTFDNSSGFSTGVATANTSDTETASVLMMFRDAAGQELVTDVLRIQVLGHQSFSLPERYPNLAGKIGSVEFQNTTGGSISVLGLRFSQSGSVTSIPPVRK